MREFVNWEAWEAAGQPLPGTNSHRAMMPYARSSAQDARLSGIAGVDFREAAVLVGVEEGGRIALIERTPEKGPHGGQMALPGGAREQGESMKACALREWREELGLDVALLPLRDPVPLTEVHVVPSGFVVRPFIAPVSLPSEFIPDTIEVAAVHRVSLLDLTNNQYRQHEAVRVQMPGKTGFRWTVPGFALPGVPFVWGATALILSEVADWFEQWSTNRG